MPRSARMIVGGYVYHVLNRANGRLRLFRKDADFAAFEAIVAEAFERVPLRILGCVVMGNHWHFVVWPRRGQGQQVTAFFRWLSITHAQRWHAHHATAGMGHVYQGRFKSFPVATDEQCRLGGGGSRTSTLLKAKRKWPPSSNACCAVGPSAARPASTRWPSSCDWNTLSVPAAVPRNRDPRSSKSPEKGLRLGGPGRLPAQGSHRSVRARIRAYGSSRHGFAT
jgi:putative transposase